MTMETYVICAGPYEESLAIVGDPDFTSRNFLECRTYIEQIAREFGHPPGTAFLFIQTEIHSFGIFRNVGIRFDPDDIEEMDFALRVENGSPRWDEISLDELGR
jgi:hypothetical protein